MGSLDTCKFFPSLAINIEAIGEPLLLLVVIFIVINAVYAVPNAFKCTNIGWATKMWFLTLFMLLNILLCIDQFTLPHIANYR